MGNFCFAVLAAVGINVATAQPIEVELRERSLQYFVDHSHPKTGLIRDRARAFGDSTAHYYRMASIAATGMGISAFAHASQIPARDGDPDSPPLMNPKEAQERIYRVLDFVEKNLVHLGGWLYHFVDWETGARWNNSEISTIDTALFIAGALHAAAVFPEHPLAKIAERLYRRINFEGMMTDGGADRHRRTLSLGWTPEAGYIKYQWKGYSELLLLIVLGLAHPENPLPEEAWMAWKTEELLRKPIVINDPDSIAGRVTTFGADMPLFIHQYSHAYLDLRGKNDGHADYFENSRLVTLYQRELARETPQLKNFVAGCSQNDNRLDFAKSLWGYSACDSKHGYSAFTPKSQNGTFCLGCAGASVMFEPTTVLADLTHWARGNFREQIYGKYGFIDALNLEQGYFATDVIGITAGALYLSLANIHPSHTIWSTFANREDVRRGMQRAGFVPNATK